MEEVNILLFWNICQWDGWMIQSHKREKSLCWLPDSGPTVSVLCSVTPRFLAAWDATSHWDCLSFPWQQLFMCSALHRKFLHWDLQGKENAESTRTLHPTVRNGRSVCWMKGQNRSSLTAMECRTDVCNHLQGSEQAFAKSKGRGLSWLHFRPRLQRTEGHLNWRFKQLQCAALSARVGVMLSKWVCFGENLQNYIPGLRRQPAICLH